MLGAKHVSLLMITLGEHYFGVRSGKVVAKVLRKLTLDVCILKPRTSQENLSEE